MRGGPTTDSATCEAALARRGVVTVDSGFLEEHYA